MRLGGVVLAFSGGKDSTCVALLLLDSLEEWGVERVQLLYGETFSEYAEVHNWAARFMGYYRGLLEERGVTCSFCVAKPRPEDTFYWRVMVYGYAAPTYKFRWCQNLLKIKPLKGCRLDGRVLLLGHREDESTYRRRLLSRVEPGATHAAVLAAAGGLRKVYPIRGWSTDRVFSFLHEKCGEHPILDELLKLYCYGMLRVRYGCWHCTLARRLEHPFMQGGQMLWLEAARLLYRLASDTPALRAAKASGYSGRGFLLPEARSLIASSWLAAEKLSGAKIYGLDECAVDGTPLRELLFDAPQRIADRLILHRSPAARLGGRFTTVEDVRPGREKQAAEQVRAELEKRRLREREREILHTLLDHALCT